jgi:hypothetical protein
MLIKAAFAPLIQVLDKEIELELVHIDIQNKFWKFRDEHKSYINLQVSHAYAIRAIKIAWIALGEIILKDREYMHEEVLAAESLLSFAEEEITAPLAETGQKIRSAGRRGGQGKGKSEKIKSRYDEWQKQADQMWKKNPKFSKNRVAVSIAQKTKENANTIRRIIKK